MTEDTQVTATARRADRICQLVSIVNAAGHTADLGALRAIVRAGWAPTAADAAPARVHAPMRTEDVPEAAVQALAEKLLRDYESEHNADHLTWQDFARLSREQLAVAWPHMITWADDAITEAVGPTDPNDPEDVAFSKGVLAAIGILRGEV